MEFKKLTDEQILLLCENTLPKHFPKSELKPLPVIQKLIQSNHYIGYGLYDTDDFSKDSILKSYALFATDIQNDFLLLDYFATMQEYRNQRLGEAFLSNMSAIISGKKGFFIEMENPDKAVSKDDELLQKRRLGFYLRNGAIDTGITVDLFSVPFKLLYFSLNSAASHNNATAPACLGVDYQSEMKAIYHIMFPPKYYKKIHLQ